jgi:hypothetical protein
MHLRVLSAFEGAPAFTFTREGGGVRGRGRALARAGACAWAGEGGHVGGRWHAGARVMVCVGGLGARVTRVTRVTAREGGEGVVISRMKGPGPARFEPGS